jgi:hypothetical protein
VKIKKEKRNFLSLGSVERVSVGWQEQKRARENLRCMLFASEIWKSLECSFFLAQKARRRIFCGFFSSSLFRAGGQATQESERGEYFPFPGSCLGGLLAFGENMCALLCHYIIVLGFSSIPLLLHPFTIHPRSYKLHRLMR